MEIEQLSYWSFDPQEHRKTSPLWQGYSPDQEDDKVDSIFKAKYGYKPATKKRYDSCLLAGPIIEK